jgi:hypothetical protein
MTDVLDQLIAFIGNCEDQTNEQFANSLLKQFEVTPKPAVDDVDLGRMLVVAINWPSLEFSCPAASEASYIGAGERIRNSLDAAGLKIVRVDE